MCFVFILVPFSSPHFQSRQSEDRATVVKPTSYELVVGGEKAFFLHPAAAKQPSNKVCGILMSERRMERTQKGAGERL